jgi:hypothetical protein
MAPLQIRLHKVQLFTQIELPHHKRECKLGLLRLLKQGGIVSVQMVGNKMVLAQLETLAN